MIKFHSKIFKYKTKIFESSCLENQNNPIWPTCSKQQILIKQECGWLWWGSIWWKVFQVLRFVDKYLDLWNIFLDLFGISVTKTNRRDHLYFSQIMIQWEHAMASHQISRKIFAQIIMSHCLCKQNFETKNYIKMCMLVVYVMYLIHSYLLVWRSKYKTNLIKCCIVSFVPALNLEFWVPKVEWNRVLSLILQLNKYNKSSTCNLLMTFLVKMIHSVDLILIEKLLN